MSEQGCGGRGGLEASFAAMPRLQLCFLNLNLLHRGLLFLKAYPLSTHLLSWQSLHFKQNSSPSESLITHFPRKHVERRKSLLCLFVQMWTRGTVRKVNPSSLAMRTGRSQPQTSPTRGCRCPAQMLLSGGCPQRSQQPQSWAGSAWGINVTRFSQSQARISYWDEEFTFGSLSCRLML